MDTDTGGTTSFANEGGRIERRRTALALEAGAPRRALALSGGGIRSATFALGVLQALARKPLTTTQPANDRRSLLYGFDYLSTVSGGGYIGSFFASLFVPGRLDGATPAPPGAAAQTAVPAATATTAAAAPAVAQASIEAARRAYDVMAYEPPGRIRAGEDYATGDLGRGPLAWLRENGRYLTPTGAGDLLYGVVLAIRNWLAVHYVIGTLFVFGLSAIALARSALAFVDSVGDYEVALLPPMPGGYWWWSLLWWLPIAMAAAWVVPVGVAFWLTHPQPAGSVRDPPRPLTIASAAAVALGLLLAAVALWAAWPDGIDGILARDTDAYGNIHWNNPPALSAAIAAVMALFGFVFFVGSQRHAASVAEHRVILTRELARAFKWTIAVALVAAVDSIGQSVYVWLIEGGMKQLAPMGLLAAAVWMIRKAAFMLDERAKPGWLAKVPLGIAATALGAMLLVLVAVIWELLVHWLQWRGARPTELAIVDPQRLWILLALTLVSFTLAWTAGRFPGFVNLSTLQSLYGARLTRAYLGASNGRRFAPGTRGADIRSVAEPDAQDQLTHAQYYAPDVLAPVHIVNVTVNQTSDPAEQLTQRDRKGRPLAILPSGFTIDGTFAPFRRAATRSELDTELTMGEWIGTSGAAFTTGLGRATNLGVSLVLGLANVRLGVWWRSGCGVDLARGLDRLFGKVFRSQAFLAQELIAKFHGLRRIWQYLSDGGHFENTGIYELLRPERDVALIVACDDGCDEAYQFGDLANLIRLARIDFGIEIEVDAAAAADPVQGEVFGTIADFAKRKRGDTKCALLLNVYDTRPARSAQPRCRIIVIKPRTVKGLAIDVANYAASHPLFPQEPTSDQFFDEAQWEAYRKLGMDLATRVIDCCRRGTTTPLL
jgi:hypothetical protein